MGMRNLRLVFMLEMDWTRITAGSEITMEKALAMPARGPEFNPSTHAKNS